MTRACSCLVRDLAQPDSMVPRTAPRLTEILTSENPGKGSRTRVTILVCQACRWSWIVRKEPARWRSR